MFDSHTHLNLSPLIDDPARYYWNAKNAGVTGMMLVGADVGTSEIAAKMTTEFDMCVASVGIHPDEASTDENVAADQMQKIEALLSYPKVRAIGETGLDYYGSVDREAQKKLFVRHIDLAKKHVLPLIIHCRNTRVFGEESSEDAYEDLLQILESTPDIPKCILHCASGPATYIQRALALGAYISFAGNVTYPSASNIRALVSLVPDDRILIETDAPFLSPQSKRGTTNEPAYMVETCQQIADIRAVSFDEIDRLTTANAKRIFGISS